ncbi:hypothetical protein ACH4Q7_22380 [Streptomyces roseolus]|uniref:hypothetical protein n=1 Tax=Streptomyces roseolus TaxID=67358 RepID=UPI0037A4C8E8
MNELLAAVMAVLAGTALLLVLVPVRRRDLPTASFRIGPLWSWCPTEERLTPHLTDHRARRCLSCKTTTKDDDHA